MTVDNTVIECFARTGAEVLISPEEADEVISVFERRPDLWLLVRKWETVQSIVSVRSVRTGRTHLSWLMPVQD